MMRYRSTLAAVGLVAVAAVAQQPQAPAQGVEVTLRNFRFEPGTIALQAGQRYVIHLVNRGGGGHDFTAKAFFEAARIDPADAKRVRGGTVEVKGGEVVDIRLTAPAPGRYDVHCGHFMHSTFGMKGEIVVS